MKKISWTRRLFVLLILALAGFIIYESARQGIFAAAWAKVMPDKTNVTTIKDVESSVSPKKPDQGPTSSPPEKESPDKTISTKTPSAGIPAAVTVTETKTLADNNRIREENQIHSDLSGTKSQNLPIHEDNRERSQKNAIVGSTKIFDEIVDAYIYAYPLVLMKTMEQEMTKSLFFAPKNKMSYFTMLPPPHIKVVECPNVDSLMSTAWLDVTQEAQVICMPEAPDHSYIMELVDLWTNVVSSFGGNQTNDFPTAEFEGRRIRYFYVAGPTTSDQCPKGIKTIIAPTNSVWLINRVLFGPPRAENDPDIAATARTLYGFEVVGQKTFEKAIAKNSKTETDQSSPKTGTKANETKSESSKKKVQKSLPLLFPVSDGNIPFQYSGKNIWLTGLVSDDFPTTANSRPVPKKNEKSVDPPKIDLKKNGSEEDESEEDESNENENEDVDENETDDEVQEIIEKNLKEDESPQIEEEIETEEDIELGSPITLVQYRRYRSRPVYPRYSQEYSSPAVLKESTETFQIGPVLFATPQENESENQSVKTRSEDNSSKKIKPKESNLKKAEQAIHKEVRQAGEKLETAAEASKEAVKKAQSDIDRTAERVWKDTKKAAKGSYEYSKNAVEYMDRRFHRDAGRLVQHLGNWFDWNNRTEMPAEKVERMNADDFFLTFAKAFSTESVPMEDKKMTELLKQLGLMYTDKKQIDPNSEVRYLMRFAAPYALGQIRQGGIYNFCKAPKVNNWFIPEKLGQYGTEYLRRAIVANEFIGANVPEQILYPFTLLDQNGEFLNGKDRYILHFPAGQTPPTDLLWSVTMYDQQHYLVPNKLNRYGIRSNLPLVYNRDGSLDIFIGHDEPKEMTSNWLPAPKGEFMLMTRIYQPKKEALDGSWKIPPVVKVVATTAPAKGEKQSSKK